MTYLSVPLNADAPCTPCPPRGVDCTGGTLALHTDAWYSVRDNPTVDGSTEMHTCFNDECCVIAGAALACDESKGYFGPLCGACDRDNAQKRGAFTRSGRGCEACWPPWASWLAFCGIGVGALAVLIYLVVRHSFAAALGDYSACALPSAPFTASTSPSPPLRAASLRFSSLDTSRRPPKSGRLAPPNGRRAGHLQGEGDGSLQPSGVASERHRRRIAHGAHARQVRAAFADLRPVSPQHGAAAGGAHPLRADHAPDGADRATRAPWAPRGGGADVQGQV